MESFRQDLRTAFRGVARQPALASVTIATLALGIGATTAIFSVVRGVLLQPLPYPASEQIVQLFQVDKDGNRMSVSDPNFADWQAQSQSFVALAQVQGPASVSVSGDVEPARVSAATVSRDFLRILRVQPTVGRAFSAEEQQRGAAPTVLVSHRFWQTHLGGRADVVGKTLIFGSRVHRVIGVLPPSVDFPQGADLFTPRELEVHLASRTAHNWAVVGRLRDGVTLAEAQADVSAISRRLKREHGDDTWMVDASVVPLHEQIVGRIRPALLVLLGGSALLLLIACANVANLLLARAAMRQRELAVRVAMGASRRRLVQQFLAESLVISVAAAAVGVVTALLGIRLLIGLDPASVPRLYEVRISWSVLLFATGVALATAVVLGLITAWRGATDDDLRGSLAQSQRGLAAGGGVVRGGLAVAQVALTLVLLIGAGLLSVSFLRLISVDPGYRTDGALVLDLSLTWPETEVDAARQRRFVDDLSARLRTIPGVTDVGGINVFPLRGGGSNGTFIVMSHVAEQLDMRNLPAMLKDPERSGYAEYRVASDGYFRAMGIPLISGRLFDERDGSDRPHVAVISQSLAAQEWPRSNALGRVIQFGNMDGDLTPFTIVGIVGDVRDRSLDAEPRPTLYGSARQRKFSNLSVVIHGPAEPTAVAGPARRALRELAPSLPPRFRTLRELVAASMTQRRFSLALLAAFGAAALLLATMGVYSVIAYLVAQREHEIGIRVALGAQRRDVLTLVLTYGMTLTLAGVVAGLAAAFWLTRLLSGLLYDITPTDPTTFAGVLSLVIGVALVATYVPARRAARVDPITVLRNG